MKYIYFFHASFYKDKKQNGEKDKFKIAMVVVNAGKFPDYFKYAIITASRSKLIDWFIFVTEMPKDMGSYPNIKFIQVNNLLDKIAFETFAALNLDVTTLHTQFASFLRAFREKPSLLVQSVFSNIILQGHFL